MSNKSRKRKARIRKREAKAIQRREALAPYLAELERSHVLPSVIRQVAPLMAILVGAKGEGLK
jgi:hypothetical protein